MWILQYCTLIMFLQGLMTLDIYRHKIKVILYSPPKHYKSVGREIMGLEITS